MLLGLQKNYKNIEPGISESIQVVLNYKRTFTYGSAKSIGKAVSWIFDGELNPIP